MMSVLPTNQGSCVYTAHYATYACSGTSAAHGELALELVNLALEGADHLLVGVLVHNSLVLDLLGAISVAKCAKRLLLQCACVHWVCG